MLLRDCNGKLVPFCDVLECTKCLFHSTLVASEFLLHLVHSSTSQNGTSLQNITRRYGLTVKINDNMNESLSYDSLIDTI